MQDENGAEVVEDETGVNESQDVAGDADQQQEQQAEKQQPAEDETEVVITLGDEPPPADEFDGLEPTPAIRQLREAYKEKSRRLRELEKQVAAQQVQQAAPQLTLPPKPTIENPTGRPEDEYDAEKYEAALLAWHEKKLQIEAAQKAADADREAQAQEWRAIEQNYAEARAKAIKRVPDFEEAEHVVISTLPQWQQQVILDGAKNPEMLIAAIGKNPEKAKELAAIKRFGKFAWAVSELEMNMKVTPRNGTNAPPPERVLRSSVPGAVVGDNKLEKLREKARTTGDWSDYFAEKNRKEGK